MKTLQQHIDEKLVINKDFKNDTIFVYKKDYEGPIKVFDPDWPDLKNFADKVYIGDRQIEISHFGFTKEEFEPGMYEFEIKDLDKLTDCHWMFYGSDIYSVPWFDISKVKNMNGMFNSCSKLKIVPKFEVDSAKDMEYMFAHCRELKEVPFFNVPETASIYAMFKKTILNKTSANKWAEIYDFVTYKDKR